MRLLALPLVVLFLLPACGADTCEVENVDVADDAPLGDLPFTAADVLAAVSGERDLMVTDAAGVPTAATFTVTRGEGSAVFNDATFTGRLSGDDVNPFYTNYDLQPPCNDTVTMPVSVALVVEELGLDVVIAGTAKPPVDFTVPEALGAVWLDGNLPGETATLPTPPENAARAFLQATFDGGELLTLRLAWSIEEGGSSSSEEILEFRAE